MLMMGMGLGVRVVEDDGLMFLEGLLHLQSDLFEICRKRHPESLALLLTTLLKIALMRFLSLGNRHLPLQLLKDGLFRTLVI